MAKVYDTATDIITFARSSSGTALRRVGYGDELVVDGAGNWVGDFDVAADLDEWGQGGTTLVSVSGGTATVSYNGGNATLSKIITVTAGKVYRVTGSISNVVSTGPRFKLGSSAGATDYFNAQAAGDYDEIIVATSGTLSIYVQCIGAGSLDLDNVSVKEVIFDRVTDDLVLFNHPDDLPRIEYAADGSLKGLLIEEQRTNLIYPSGFPTAASGTGWQTPNNSTAAVDQTGPDDLTSATTLTASSTGYERMWRIATTQSNSTTYTLSFYAKAGSSAYVYARNIAVSGNPAVDSVLWDVSDFSVASTGTGITAAGSQPVGNGWYRCYMTATTASSPANDLVDIGIADTTGALSVTAGKTGIFYGAQLEEGSFATSYIPTSGSQSTRSPDIASIPVSAFGYNQEAGTVVVEQSTFNDFKNAVVWQVDDGTPLNRHVFNAFNGNTTVVNGGSIQASLTHTGQNLNTTYKHGFGYKLNSFASVYDGGGPVTNALGTVPTVSILRFGADTGPAAYLNGHIKSLSYFPRRLTDAQLQELTS